MSASSAGVAAAVAAQRKKLIRHFVSIGAVSPESAVAPESLPHIPFHMLDRLKKDRVVGATVQGNLFLDQAREVELQAKRKAMALKILVVVLVLAAATIGGAFILSAAA